MGKRSGNRSKNKNDNEDEFMLNERDYLPDEDEIISAVEEVFFHSFSSSF